MLDPYSRAISMQKYVVWINMPEDKEILTPELLQKRVEHARAESKKRLNQIVSSSRFSIKIKEFSDTASFSIESEEDLRSVLAKQGLKFYTID